MKYYLKFIRLYYSIISAITPKYAAKKAFMLFQTVRIKTFKKREKALYEKGKHFKVAHTSQELDCYELGNPDGPLIFLVHGWDSNAGSLSKFAFQLAENNYNVVCLDLPAHAHATSQYTNLYDCKEAFMRLIEHINPQTPFSVISHSFGSAVVSTALANSPYEVDKLIFLTTPNKLIQIFKEFKKIINLGDNAFEKFLEKAYDIFEERVEEISVQEKIKTVQYQNLLLIHDKHDKALPYKNSVEIANSSKNTTLISFEKIGHYRMLWEQQVVDATLDFLKEESIKEISEVL